MAKEIKKWLDNTFLPTIMKHGSFSIQPKSINVKLFYEMTAISNFFRKAVMYIAYVGKINGEYVFKYGLSRKMFERDYEQHSKHFDKFKVVFIGETDNCEQIENLFDNDLKIYNLHRHRLFNLFWH